MAIPQKTTGKTYYISSKPHETQVSLSLGDPEKDGPERNGQDDQLTLSGRNQLSMSTDEQGYIRPHNLAISHKINRNPESTNQNLMSPDEQAHISPYNLAVKQKIGGKKYYIHSKPIESHHLSMNREDCYYYYKSDAHQKNINTRYFNKRKCNKILRLILPKKTTEVDKYKKCKKIQGKHTRIVLVTQHKKTIWTKNQFISINVPSPMTTVTLDYSKNPEKTHKMLTPNQKQHSVSINKSRHLVMPAKTIKKYQPVKNKWDEKRKTRQCTAKEKSTGEKSTNYRIWNIPQTRKSGQVINTNYCSDQKPYNCLDRNGQEVNPLLVGVLRVHFTLDSTPHEQNQEIVNSNLKIALTQKKLVKKN